MHSQSDSLDPKENNPFAQLLVKPSDTDPTIKSADYPHLVLYDSTASAGKLFLFLPGTGGLP
ncbi:MAG TPA: hypothetical protein VNX68_05550, partial [Nitrosopumilaceae archaeon]|nr:hypothetical protein [Nitrosopumilaceae archaeon]